MFTYDVILLVPGLGSVLILLSQIWIHYRDGHVKLTFPRETALSPDNRFKG